MSNIKPVFIMYNLYSFSCWNNFKLNLKPASLRISAECKGREVKMELRLIRKTVACTHRNCVGRKYSFKKKKRNQVAKCFLRKKLAGKHPCIKKPSANKVEKLTLVLPFFAALEKENSYQHFDLLQKQAAWLAAIGSPAVKTLLWLILILHGNHYHPARSTLQKVNTVTVLLLTCFNYFKHIFLKQI